MKQVQISTAVSMNRDFKANKRKPDPDKCPYCESGFLTAYRIHPEYSENSTFDCTPCPYCGGTGKKRFTSAESKEMQIKADIPSRFRGVYLDSVDWNAWGVDFSEGEMFIRDFVENFNDWKNKPCGLYFVSKTRGSGKTFLSAAIGNELLRKGRKVRFLPATDILRIVTDKGKSDRGENTLWDRIRACELLIVDDLGSKKSGGEWHADEVLNLIDHRYSNNLVTIVTSNEPIAKLKFDERTISRLYDSCIELSFPEKSIRTEQAREKKSDFMKSIRERQQRGG